MGIKRIVLGLVTLTMAAISLAAGLSAATPNVYYDMLRGPVGTSVVTPQVYYDM